MSKTLDEILDGATARGQWEIGPARTIIWREGFPQAIGHAEKPTDAELIVRAARNFEPLVKMTQLLQRVASGEVEFRDAEEALEYIDRVTRAALAEALKD